MDCTGERYMPEVDGDWTLEHTHRYFLARELAAGKAVLDIACGEGYGSRMLAETAESVVGVDISGETVDAARARYPHPRLSFLRGDAVAIPLPDSSVDLVTSFETIEHLADHEGMLREIRRVLRPEGLLLISSPDKYEYSDRPGFVNAFHVKELYRDEFEELLRQHFAHVRLLGQRIVFGSLVAGETEAPFFSWRKNDPASRTAGLIEAEYLIALAGATALPALPSGLLKHAVAQSDVAMRLTQKTEELSARLAWYEDWEQEARGYIAALEREREALQRERQASEARESALRQELAGVYASHSWRFTEPLRNTKLWMRRALKRGAAAEKAAWPPDVRALEKPLRLASGPAPEMPVLGVFLHIYYPEVAEEMLACLSMLPDTARVHVSTDSESKGEALAALFAARGMAGRTEIRVCPNQGWDIAPFLVGFSDVIPRYPLILRLHSKRSVQLPGNTGAAWRAMLYNALAGSKERVNAILQAFAEDRKLGLVCPPVVAHWADHVHFGGNFPQMRDLLSGHGIRIQENTPIDFPMGSMFWCRPEVLSPWLEKRFSYADFAPLAVDERDGSLAHALERLFFFGCGIAGFSWARVPALPESKTGGL